MKKTFMIAFVLATFLIASVGYAAVPNYITLQGRLTDVNNNPINVPQDFGLKIYDASTGGNLIWSETQTDVAVTNGIFNILLGNTQTLSGSFDKDYWVEISVESTTLSPRVRLTTSPYAYYSRTATEISPDIYVNTSGDTMTGPLSINIVTGLTPTAISALKAMFLGNGILGGSAAVNGTCIGTNCYAIYGKSANDESYSGYFEGGKGIYMQSDLELYPTLNVTKRGSVGYSGWFKGGIGIWADNVTTNQLNANKIITNEIDAKSNGQIWSICNTPSCVAIVGGVASGGSTGTSKAVYGYADFKNAYSGYFVGGHGVYMSTNGGSDANLLTPSTTLEVHNTKTSDFVNPTAVYGESVDSAYKSIGVYGKATGIAVLGNCSSTYGYSGYFIGGNGVQINGNLDVNGNIAYSGTLTNAHINEGGITLAGGPVEGGDILVISKDSDISAELSSTAYDTKLFGVALDSKNRGEIIGVVILGKFQVKVTAENGAIERGDLLTVSSKPGYAMKCDDKIKCLGAIVGKALQPLSSGEGKIDVMVDPQ